ncbi:MAG: hypothetical protein IPM42_00495 [Saprospiraceae bacterium]|nr:hypothetical protein [Saprospiraceae bacterium]
MDSNTILLKEQHIDNDDLLKKVKLLFEYRLFPELLKIKTSINETGKSEFYDKLIRLQTSIYYLDAHLEAHKNPDSNVLHAHWQNIYSELHTLEVKEGEYFQYVSHIIKYQKHELELRSEKSPLRFKMAYFYFYKSCDVKLLRRLIYEKFGLSSQLGALSYWRNYDLITEVNDDVEDVFEDLNFFNGNRFLISLISLGKIKTRTDFNQFINEIESRNNIRHIHDKYSFRTEFIFENTRNRIKETRQLLVQRMDEVSDSIIRDSLLFSNKLLKTYE